MEAVCFANERDANSKSKKVNDVVESTDTEYETSSDDKGLFIIIGTLTLAVSKVCELKDWTEIIKLNNSDVKWKIDTGAECNVTSESN